MDDLCGEFGRQLSRRRLMQGVAVASIGLVLSACGQGGSSTAEQPTASSNGTDDGAAALDGELVEVWRDPG